MKVLIRFLLSLSFILLNGYSYSYAFSYESADCNPLIQIKKNVEEITQERGPVLLKAIATPIENDQDSIEVAESKDEEEKLRAFKSVEVSQYFSSLYDALTSVYFCRYRTNCYTFCPQFSYTSANKYIVLRVLRL